MDAASWGALSALSFGSADFIARFTGRHIGVEKALLGVLVIGIVPMTLYLGFASDALVWPGLAGGALILVYGVLMALATLLLYEGLARGPITVVAPVVAAHPALVVLLAVLMGRTPDPLQWTAIAVVLAGALITARFASEAAEGEETLTRATLIIAVAACCSYAGVVAAGQAVAPQLGGAVTGWAGRLVAIAALLVYIGFAPTRPKLPAPRMPFLLLLGVQGVLDAGGHVLLLAGSHGENPEIAAVTASCFGAVTTLLAFFILRERVNAAQWSGIGLVFVGVAVLATAH